MPKHTESGKTFFKALAEKLKTRPWRRQLIKLPFLLLLPLALWLKEIASANSASVEKVYSSGIYPVIANVVGFLTGWMHFSLAEILLYALVVAVPVYVVWQIVLVIIKPDRALRGVKVVLNLALLASVGYFLFIGMWGLNYYRQPLAVTLGYTVTDQSVPALEKLCKSLAQDANRLRAEVTENSKGVMVLKEGKSGALREVADAYASLSKEFTGLKVSHPQPKPVLLSRQLSYTNIEGIFIPFTMEPNLNADMPDSALPSAACHEAAHEQGFAREDEANFLSYLACMASGNPEFEYSGTMMALNNSMNALYAHDEDAYFAIAGTYSDAIRRDQSSEGAYWAQFQGPVATASGNINNAYLKSNKQADGVFSYGRMVDLLLAKMASGK